ncbi:FecCD family ABC transporter permease [Salinibius halmophilus]|uniref:FecCD family ABC transporter permease n=1 Tax=Salinibius halmophilus TaxID=1853216 RepID=UPI000E674C00|nr:iron ABC transporter permease [Salinibius halmophilus]
MVRSIKFWLVPISAAAMVLASLVGPVPLSLEHWFSAIQLRGDATGAAAVVWQLRLPRVVLGFLIGGGLAVSGAAIQGMVRNPLADPGLIGVTAGAMLFAALSIVLAGSWPMGIALSAFLGAVITTYLVMALAGREAPVVTMILAGVIISALAGAVVGALNYIADDNELRALTFWTMGSLANVSWFEVAIMLPVVLLALGLLWRVAKSLDALLLGEGPAMEMGVNPRAVKHQVVIATALFVGVAVAFAGIIGFVGLVIPHMVRFVVGALHRHLLPVSFFVGGIFIVLCDAVTRVIAPPAEVPIGILTSFIGAPVFIYLLMRAKRHGNLFN